MAMAVKSGLKTKPRAQEIDDEEYEAPVRKASAKRAVAQEDPDDNDVDTDTDTDTDEDDAPAPKKGAAASRKAAAADDDDGDTDGDDDGVIDMTGVDEDAMSSFELLPKGNYTCQVLETEFVEFSTGSKGMKITLEVSEGEYAKSKSRKRASRLFTNLVMKKESAAMLKAGLKAMGVPKKVYNDPAFSVKKLQRIADSGDLVGAELVAQVKIRPYDGEKRNSVGRLMLPSEAGGAADVATGKGGFLDD